MCERIKPKNCYLSLSSGNCLVCKNDFAPDINNKCVLLNQTQIIKNCFLYFGFGKCAKCKGNYYVSRNGDQCLKSNLKNQENCEIFGDQECLKCQDGFIFNQNKNICECKFFFSKLKYISKILFEYY
jgi:hypothetical protein